MRIVYCLANDGNLIVSPMTKTEIIGFDQKIYRTVKLVDLSDTLTQNRRRRHGRCRGGVRGEAGRAVQECFFCPSYFLSPYFSKYTNDETLKTNKKRLNINHILVQFLHRDFFSVAYSIWVRRVASAYLLSEPTIFLGKCLYQARNVLFFSCSVD